MVGRQTFHGESSITVCMCCQSWYPEGQMTLAMTPPVANVAGLRRMTLSSLLTVGQIIPEMKATERWPAITEIVDLLVSTQRIEPQYRDSVLAALKQREETMSTGIGFGIAIPHASSEHVTEVVAAFGRSKAGIEFDSLDNELVHFIVLFIVPRDQFQVHLRTLAAIAKFLNDRTVREELASAPDAQSILQVFASRGGQR
jgi:mannitol/fructose-specific phosphotransferase system IIA component (Ntr-type)